MRGERREADLDPGRRAPYRTPVPTRLPAPLRAPVLILAVLALLWPRAAVTPLSSYDQRFYLGIAYDLRHFGRFTDGFSYAGGGPDTARPPGMRFTPLYPAFLAATARFDPALREAIGCVERSAGRDPACPRAAPVARFAQFLMLAGFYWLLWGAIGRATGCARTGWIGLGLALMTAPLLLLSVNTLMTETMGLLLSAAACALAAEAAGRMQARRVPWWLGCGVTLGLAILCRPSFLYLAWGGLAVGALIAIRGRHPAAVAALAAFAGGTVLVVLPWLLRNALVLHRFTLSFGYASHTLIQRVAFDAMNPREYGLSFVCWLPDGSGLGRLLAGRHACDRFGWDEHPDSFYAIGTGPLMQRSLAASGGWPGHMHYVVHHYLLAEPLRHLLVTVPLALRGLYVDHYWGLLLAPVSALAIVSAARRRAVGILLLSLPAWLLLLFNALVAVNQPRYNLLLILPFSLAGAMLIEHLWQRARGGSAPQHRHHGAPP
jgi:4-amino-4-deoxy-L-arabinose transferase-like glycosyltransferase